MEDNFLAKSIFIIALVFIAMLAYVNWNKDNLSERFPRGGNIIEKRVDTYSSRVSVSHIYKIVIQDKANIAEIPVDLQTYHENKVGIFISRRSEDV